MSVGPGGGGGAGSGPPGGGCGADVAVEADGRIGVVGAEEGTGGGAAAGGGNCGGALVVTGGRGGAAEFGNTLVGGEAVGTGGSAVTGGGAGAGTTGDSGTTAATGGGGGAVAGGAPRSRGSLTGAGTAVDKMGLRSRRSKSANIFSASRSFSSSVMPAKGDQPSSACASSAVMGCRPLPVLTDGMRMGEGIRGGGMDGGGILGADPMGGVLVGEGRRALPGDGRRPVGGARREEGMLSGAVPDSGRVGDEASSSSVTRAGGGAVMPLRKSRPLAFP